MIPLSGEVIVLEESAVDGTVDGNGHFDNVAVEADAEAAGGPTLGFGLDSGEYGRGGLLAGQEAAAPALVVFVFAAGHSGHEKLLESDRFLVVGPTF